MRRLLLLAPALLGLLQTGCMSGACSPYWRFECGKAGGVTSNAVYTQGSGPVGIAGLAASGAVFQAPPARSLAALAQESPCDTLPPPRPALAATPGCSMDDLCRLLYGIDRKLSALTISGKPMPSAP
jgi:hypothetical protein